MYRIFVLFMVWVTVLCAARESVQISREDGSVIQGYLDLPQGKGSFPVVIFIDGSSEESVLKNHEKLASRFVPQKMGVLSLEKRGISAQGMDAGEFIVHDCFEERLRDHRILLKDLEQGKLKGCNGKTILMGGSEGGKIAPALALAFPKAVLGLVLVGSGGGLSFSEEMKYNSQQQIRKVNPLRKLGYKIRRVFAPREYEEYHQKMLHNPDSLEMCGPKTWKWWASYLRYHPLSDLLRLEVPIYMIHGEKDSVVPVRSADRVQEAFDQQGKKNLLYVRPKDMEHSMKGREDVYGPMITWIQTRCNTIDQK